MKIRFKFPKKLRFQKLFKVSKEFKVSAPLTSRVVEISKAFGLGVDEEKTFTLFDGFEIEVNPGDIVYVTGESGGGKTTLLYMLLEEMTKHREFQPIISDRNLEIKKNEIVIEGVGETLEEALDILSHVGLNDAFILLRRYDELSDGQKYRYRLAKAIHRNAKTLVFDEFCATLDRETAKIVSHLIQKICRKKGITLIAASTHTDIVEDLNPNVLVCKGLGREVKVEYRENVLGECSVLKDVVIEEGCIRDLRELEFWHYKGAYRGYGGRIYRARLGERLVGVVLYTPTLFTIHQRFIAFPHLLDIYRRSKKEYLNYLNKYFRRLARIIVHPKYRGIGLAVKIVKETMPLLEVPYIECFAVMPRYNPFLKKAGMIEIGVKTSKTLEHIYMQLEEIGFNLDLIRSKKHNLQVLKKLDKEKLRRLRKLVLNNFFYEKFHVDVKLFRKVKRGDLEALAEALKRTPVPVTYLVWKNPRYPEFLDPVYTESQKN